MLTPPQALRARALTTERGTSHDERNTREKVIRLVLVPEVVLQYSIQGSAFKEELQQVQS